ncbi:hypothetical protein [Herbidospora sp. RD11066]
MAESYRNYAGAGSSGFTQIGKVLGDVHIGATSGTLQEQLDGVRRALAAAEATGEIDAETREEAGAELDTLHGEQDKGRMVRTLRRIKGLAEGSADTVARVAGVIAAVQGLQ